MKNKKLLSYFGVLTFILLYNCQNETLDITSSSKIEILNTKDITFTSVEVNSKIIQHYNKSDIHEFGICYDTKPNVSISNKKIANNNSTNTLKINKLLPNTKYYIKAYIKDSYGVWYSEESHVTTLSLTDTKWDFKIHFQNQTNYTINSIVNFYTNGSTKFEEVLPNGNKDYLHYGSWSLNENKLTFIFNGTNNNLNEAIYIFTGTLEGMTLTGNYTHRNLQPGTWSATQLLATTN